MSSRRIGETHSTLLASRAEAARTVADATAEAELIEAGAGSGAGPVAARRIADLRALQEAIGAEADYLEQTSEVLAEWMAHASDRLAVLSATADFEPPLWPGGIADAVDRHLRSEP